jgi:predicted small lipoprotein YifL
LRAYISALSCFAFCAANAIIAGLNPLWSDAVKRLKLTAIFALLLLAGCGQKGPLFMPEQAQDNKPQQAEQNKTEPTREQEQN